MTTIHKLGLFISGFILRSTLFFGFTLLAAVMVFGDKSIIKSALLHANAYDRYSQAIVDSGKQQAQNDPNAIPLDDPRIADVVKASLDSKSLEKIAEGAVDSTYNWLNGDTKTIIFSADVTKNKEVLASGISGYAIERLANLNTCTETPSETNVFRLTCNPVNLDLAQVRQQVYDAIYNDKSIFAADTITEKDFPKAPDGRPYTDVYAKAPAYYTWFKLSPFIVLFIALIFAVLAIYFSRSTRRGVHLVATSLIGTGVILAIAPILYTYILPSAGLSLPSSGNTNDESINAISSDVMKYLYSEVNTHLINVAIQVALAGLLLLVFSKFFMKTKSPYGGLAHKTGLSLSISPSRGAKGPAVSAADVPIQTSEPKARTKKKVSALEKRFRKL